MPAERTSRMPVKLLRHLIRYDEETGKLYWRPRTPDMFRDGANRPEARCRWFNDNRAGREAFRPKRGQLPKQETILGRKYQAHPVVWALVHGHWPVDDVWHRDGDKLNNRIDNLYLHPRGGRPDPAETTSTSTPEKSVTMSQTRSGGNRSQNGDNTPARQSRPKTDISHGPDAQKLFKRRFHREISTGKLYHRRERCLYAPGKEAFASTNGAGYRQGVVLGNHLYAHHVVWVMVYGEWPRYQLGHRNGDRADNRLSNLYEKNIPRRNPAMDDPEPEPRYNPNNPYIGVHWCASKGLWAAIDRSGGPPGSEGHETLDDPVEGDPWGRSVMGRLVGTPTEKRARNNAEKRAPAGIRSCEPRIISRRGYTTAEEAREAVRWVERSAGHETPESLRIPPLRAVPGHEGVYTRDPGHHAISDDYPADQWFIYILPVGDYPKYLGPYDSMDEAEAEYWRIVTRAPMTRPQT